MSLGVRFPPLKADSCTTASTHCGHWGALEQNTAIPPLALEVGSASLSEMQNLTSEYLVEIARQMGFLSAFLGGVAATFMSQLLGLSHPGRQRGWAILCAAGSSVAFIVSVVGATSLAIVLDPNAPAMSLEKGRVLAFLPFLLGIYLLLACIGLAGSLRSRRTGHATVAIAAIGAALVTAAVVN